MNVLMFGWEYPPLSSGGLGTACYGLTKGLSNNNVGVTFVIPSQKEISSPYAKMVSAGSLKTVKIDSPLTPYMTSSDYLSRARRGAMYGDNLFDEVYRYSRIAEEIAANEDFDVIHCHDWMTYKAGIAAKHVSGKPLIVHVHATEFDRTGGNGIHPIVYEIEKDGMEQADRVIAVSQFTKDKIVYHYGINPDKVSVVHNAVEFTNHEPCEGSRLKNGNKIVLFLGRITLQKGPDYFISAAKKCLDLDSNIRFVVAGTGDMEGRMIEQAAELGIADKVLFMGFLKGADIDRAYKMADLYVMPSVSEPFGITPLEAMRNKTPVLISKQSGVSEVIKNCLKVDFWDIDQMTNKIMGVLRYSELKEALSEDGFSEVQKFDWNTPAGKCAEIYRQVTQHG